MKLTEEQCNDTILQQDIELKRWIVTIITELNNARAKFPDWPENHIEKAAIVAEEAGELIRASLQHKHEKGQYFAMHKEAIQTGAMAIRFLLEMPEKKLPGDIGEGEE